MKYIYSKVDNSILHIVVRSDDSKDWRMDVCPESEFLQLSYHNTQGCQIGKTVNPHKHLVYEKQPANITQESWIVIRGNLKASFYDIDDSLLYTTNLKTGDCSITFRGAHALEVIDQKTLFVEHKLGPFIGSHNDKEFLD
jgi:hypothetical protein